LISLVAFVQRFFLYKHFWTDYFFSILGQSIVVTFLLSLVSGTVLFFTGITDFKWLWYLHLTTSYFLTVVICLFSILVLRRTQRALNGKTREAFLKSIRQVIFKIAVSSVTMVLIPLALGFLYFETDVRVIPKSYSRPFEVNPFFPGAVKTKDFAFYKKEVFANSQSCGTTGCHEGIARQWKESTHSNTPNPFVEAVQRLMIQEGNNGHIFDQIKIEHIKELNLKKPGRETFRKCAACHAPVALITGNVDPSIPYETDKNFEGVSCTLCHSIESASGKGGGAYEVNPQAQYLFSYAQNPIGQYLHNALIRNKPELHKESYSKPFYKETGYCISCHERLHFKSWEQSTYNKGLYSEKTKHCQNCHMQEVPTSNEISARIKGTVADHRFISGGLSMARFNGKEEQFAKTVHFLKDKKIDLKVVAPAALQPGRLQTIVIRNANLGVGHNFPAGPEADIVEAWVHISVTDSQGKIIFESGKLQNDNHLDRNSTFFYHSEPFDGNGTSMGMNRHRSWRFVEDRHQVIRPKMFHDVKYNFFIPKSSSGPLSIKASLNYRKPNQEFVDWALGKGKFIVPYVEMDSEKVLVRLSTDAKELSSSQAAYKKELDKVVISGDIKKMESFPPPDHQLDVEAKILTHEAYKFLNQGLQAKAIITIEALGEAAKKTRSYKEFYQKINRNKKRGRDEFK